MWTVSKTFQMKRFLIRAGVVESLLNQGKPFISLVAFERPADND